MIGIEISTTTATPPRIFCFCFIGNNRYCTVPVELYCDRMWLRRRSMFVIVIHFRIIRSVNRCPESVLYYLLPIGAAPANTAQLMMVTLVMMMMMMGRGRNGA
jgi:hypothetical protein